VNFLFALTASVAVSAISLVGILALLLKKDLLDRTLIALVGFSAGALIGGAFLHLLPEAVGHTKNLEILFFYVILGFLIFFLLEKYLRWRHCHKESCDIHAFTYLNLIGDSVHNFGDGLIIGTSFVINTDLGIAATLAIIFHEIPQEIGDFGVLVYGGFSKFKALFYNFLSALTAVAGTILGYYFSSSVSGFSSLILPVAAGGFLYIAACDLIPEIHKQTEFKKSGLSIAAFLLGIILMLLVKEGPCH
jgi:zinc and cadmium transporter